LEQIQGQLGFVITQVNILAEMTTEMKRLVLLMDAHTKGQAVTLHQKNRQSNLAKEFRLESIAEDRLFVKG
jgi:hypothetical protein